MTDSDRQSSARLTLCLVAVAAALLSSGANAEPTTDLRRAISAYHARDFSTARDLLQSLIDRRELINRDDRTAARTYLAACHYALGEMDLARAELHGLFTDEPAAPIDPKLFRPIRPTFIELAEEIRTDVARERGDRPMRPPPSPDTLSTSYAPSATARRGVPSLAFAFVPFGVGQFANDESTKGALFLTAESVAFLTAGVALALFESKKLPGGHFLQDGTFAPEDVQAAYTLQTTYLVAFWGGVAIAVGGVIDALVSRPSPTVTVAMGPGAVVVRF